VAGGDLRVGFTQSLTNQYGEIMAGGQLRLDGAAGASVDNVAATLYRHYSVDGVRHYADGVALTYQQPGLSQVIGSVAGVLSDAQGVQITGGARSATWTPAPARPPTSCSGCTCPPAAWQAPAARPTPRAPRPRAMPVRSTAAPPRPVPTARQVQG
jgi:hypothetical protein